ncbi:MAG: hypothetical protein UMU04_00880 [Halanaerobiales bacterium]|nr:hypothetical protein [Halanaerobiales bacterium]
MIKILFFWFGVLLISAWAAHWGAGKLSFPLKMLRRQWGLTSSAGAALLAIVTASPEVSINITSAVRGVSDIGLGNLLGSNIISIPLIITVSYFASRKSYKNNQKHEQHLENDFLALNKRTVKVLALPYLAIIVLTVFLTLPQGWRGLQPVDGYIMLIAYIIFLFQAIMTGKQEGEEVSWTWTKLILSIGGAAAIAIGAYYIVRATENIVQILGIPQLIGGLFITGPLTTLPEIFQAWNISKEGEVTSGTTSVIADNVITLTIGFVPLALVSTVITDLTLYIINILFIALMPLFYTIFIRENRERYGFTKAEIFTFNLLYGIYILAILIFLF